MGRSYIQGKYTPKNPDKYKGNARDIVYRSSWELVAFNFCDNEPSVVGWSSEETIIQYRSPADGLNHRYFIDLKIWVKDPNGGPHKVFLIEIKPYSKQFPPKKTGNKSNKTFLTEVREYAINQAKWEAARLLCKKKGWQFRIWTEREIFPNGGLPKKMPGKPLGKAPGKQPGRFPVRKVREAATNGQETNKKG